MFPDETMLDFSGGKNKVTINKSYFPVRWSVRRISGVTYSQLDETAFYGGRFNEVQF